ncbi:MAG: hypothetical protein JNM17_37710 [Archangium sp.]|nr:hypothetical protein [Archangium sp.]
MAGINGINANQMPNRISMNVTTPKQTQGATFGEKVAGGLQAAGSVVSQGAQLVGGALPGGQVLSAAVSSVSALAGGGSGAAAASYAATGVVGFSGGAGGASVGGTQVTVGAGQSGGPNLLAGAGTNGIGQYNGDIASMSAQNTQMLQVQMAMQRENTMFSSISNVLKTKHDTAKNAIGNIR